MFKLKYMQVEVKQSFYQSFGGINFMEADYRRLGFSSLIAAHLGLRSLSAVYSYSDVIKTIFFTHSIGGDVLDDANTLRQQLQDHPTIKICSPDTIEYVCQQLRVPKQIITTDKGVVHQIVTHANFNRLLLALSLRGGIISTTGNYTLDYDGHIVENTKPDNARNYKQTESYYPVIGSINKLPIYIENRNGNTPENYRQLEILRQTLTQCEAEGVQIKKIRADACCYEKETVEFLESKKGMNYYIRAEMNAHLRMALEDETEWQPALLNNRKVEICSIEEKLFGTQQYRRVVAYREKVKGQLTVDEMTGYRYYAIVTNDDTDQALACIEFYNQRGCDGEHHFKELDYDFGWNKLPFDNIEMNTIYMYATAIAYLLFNIFKQQYSTKTSMVHPQMRLKNFILHFVTLTAKWIKTGRRYILKIFTMKDYRPLFST